MKKTCIGAFLSVIMLAGVLRAGTLKELSGQLCFELKGRAGIKLAVFSFPYYDGNLSMGSVKVQDELTTYLAQQTGVQVLERKLILKVLEEKKLQASGLVDDKMGVEFGKMLGADAVVSGILEDLDAGQAKVNARVVDAATGRVLASALVVIDRSWQKYEPKLDDKKRVTLELDFEPTKLADVKKPDMLAIKEVSLDLGTINLDKLEKYDAVVKYEKIENDPAKLAAKWAALAAELPEYREPALKRAAQWKDYLAASDVYERSVRDRRETLEKDYKKLSRLLNLDVVTPVQKSAFAERFLDAYGYNEVSNPYFETVRYYFLPRCVTKDRRLGYCYSDGTVVMGTDAGFSAAGSFCEGLAAVSQYPSGDKCGFIDRSGRLIVPMKYDLCDWRAGAARDALSALREIMTHDAEHKCAFSEGRAAVKAGDKWGFAAADGTEPVPPRYDEVRAFSEGLAAVRSGDKWGFVAANGTEIVPLLYDEVGDFENAVALVARSGRWGIVDRSGRELVHPSYEQIADWSEGLALVVQNGKCGFVDTHGRQVVVPKYDDGHGFHDGMAAVALNGKWGFINSAGRELVKPKYARICDYSSGVGLALESNNKFILLDKNGRRIGLKAYDRVDSGDYAVSAEGHCGFSEGLLAAGLDDGKAGMRWGYVDPSGRERLPFRYPVAYPFREGLAFVSLNGKYFGGKGFIDAAGKEIVAGKYENSGGFRERLAVVCADAAEPNRQKCGVVDMEGKEIFPLSYDSISNFEDGVAQAMNGSSIYLLDRWGRSLYMGGSR